MSSHPAVTQDNPGSSGGAHSAPFDIEWDLAIWKSSSYAAEVDQLLVQYGAQGSVEIKDTWNAFVREVGGPDLFDFLIKPISLTDFPNKVLSLICEHALLEPESVILTHLTKLKSVASHREQCTNNRHRFLVRREADRCWDKPKDGPSTAPVWVPAPRSILDLLRVNRRIGTMALDIFYGKNNIEFGTLELLRSFLKERPIRAPLFRELTITFESPKPGTCMWSALLRQFTNLEKIHLKFEQGRYSQSMRISESYWSSVWGIEDLIDALKGIPEVQITGRDWLATAGTYNSLVDANAQGAIGDRIWTDLAGNGYPP